MSLIEMVIKKKIVDNLNLKSQNHNKNGGEETFSIYLRSLLYVASLIYR